MRIIRLIGLLASVLEHLAKRTYDLIVLCENRTVRLFRTELDKSRLFGYISMLGTSRN